MINLPHQKPIRFVNDVISLEEDIAYISCSFPSIPTLAMICEAAAQSSAAFSLEKEAKIGFLVSLKEIELLKEVVDLDYEIKIKKEVNFGLLNEFSFELVQYNKLYAKGNFIIKLQD